MKRSPLKRVNAEQRAAKYLRNFDGGIGHDEWIRTMPCALRLLSVNPCGGKIQACHVKARGMGGCGGDWRQLVPLCMSHHLEQGAHPLRFPDLAMTAKDCVLAHEEEIACDLASANR